MTAEQALAAELRRQQALVAALWSPQLDAKIEAIDSIAKLASSSNTTANLTDGISAYRGNGLSTAQRALAAAYSTACALLGEEGFNALAVNYWRAQPPQCGDLGEYGADLARFITAQAPGTALEELPYLADCARLDWALHQAERAADSAAFDLQSLTLLQTADPATLHLVLAPGAALVSSNYPIVALLHAHASGDFEYASLLLAAEQGEHAWVARSGYKASAVALSASSAAFCAACLAGNSLLACLDAAAAADPAEPFDFGAWLEAAITGAWLKGISQQTD